MSATQSNRTSSTLVELSTQLADAVATASGSVVAIHARKRIPSSGIIWRDGIIVSASHTVRREEGITVTLPSGESATAIIAGRDAATDLVALRLEGGQARAAERSAADVPGVGSLVLAVGRPGQNVSASFGIISAIGEGWRTWQGTRVDRVLRLDLTIYDGFSGGALVDAQGGVLGLNNSALARGTPMALPAVTVERLLDELLERGHVRRGFIGVAIHPVALGAALVKQHQLTHETGHMVMAVSEGSPAEKAGVLVGDVLIEANGQPLRRPTDLLDALSSIRAGEPLKLGLLRGGVLQSISIAPAERNAQGTRE